MGWGGVGAGEEKDAYMQQKGWKLAVFFPYMQRISQSSYAAVCLRASAPDLREIRSTSLADQLRRLSSSNTSGSPMRSSPNRDPQLVHRIQVASERTPTMNLISDRGVSNGDARCRAEHNELFMVSLFISGSELVDSVRSEILLPKGIHFDSNSSSVMLTFLGPLPESLSIHLRGIRYPTPKGIHKPARGIEVKIEDERFREYLSDVREPLVDGNVWDSMYSPKSANSMQTISRQRRP
ncbi:hypothetical protein BDQ12DRAFT_670538 [Crucibulum laeve]|uniref:Uncharacterized protein n=1 Tax=Crucibulum laeve TaxID=68775 RepID=A0A5C3LWI1_9AGAR|nr:hypothetical protein BDQ12DRAFT_670538 [Crucibulum laeve]